MAEQLINYYLSTDLATQAELSGLSSVVSKEVVHFIKDNNNELNSVTIGTRKDDSSVGVSSFSQGGNNVASGIQSHAQGSGSTASGSNSHAEGSGTLASGIGSHAEGESCIASGTNAHAEGAGIWDEELQTMNNPTVASGEASHAEGQSTEAMGYASHSEGLQTVAERSGSHAEGLITRARGSESHAEGIMTIAEGVGSHAEGSGLNYLGEMLENAGASPDIATLFKNAASKALGVFSHTEGIATDTSGIGSHAQGFRANDNGNAFSFVWQGYGGELPSDAEMSALFTDPTTSEAEEAIAKIAAAIQATPKYESPHPGAFAINPVNGMSGFYIGEQNLNDIIDAKINAQLSTFRLSAQALYDKFDNSNSTIGEIRDNFRSLLESINR